MNSDTVLLCSCGHPAHPCYGSRCEDCYAESHHSTGPPHTQIAYRHEIGGSVHPGEAIDRRWVRHKVEECS